MISYITSAHQHQKLIIIGHSVGGQLIGISRLAKKAESFIMIGSQTPYWKNFSGGWNRIKLLTFWKVMIPVFTPLFGYFPASLLGLFEDLPRNVAKQWARWAKSNKYVFKEMPFLKEQFASLEQRTLMISFTDDELAPLPAVEDLKKHFSSLKINHWHVSPSDSLQKSIGHFGFFKSLMEPLLWNEVNLWMKGSTALKNNKAA
jgi:predicted alpha/beta hydrolase